MIELDTEAKTTVINRDTKNTSPDKSQKKTTTKNKQTNKQTKRKQTETDAQVGFFCSTNDTQHVKITRTSSYWEIVMDTTVRK